MSSSIDERKIREVVYRGCLALDAEDFDGFMGFCSSQFKYRITVYSPDLRKEMIWLSHDYVGIKAMLESIPQHFKRLGTLKRHVSVYLIEQDAGAPVAKVTSSFLVTSTDPEGRSRLFCAGTYFDEVSIDGGVPMLTSRQAHLETRDLGIGTHIPL